MNQPFLFFLKCELGMLHFITDHSFHKPAVFLFISQFYAAVRFDEMELLMKFLPK